MAATIRIDTTRLAAQFRRYRDFSKRGLAEDVNQKSYSILIAAPKFTRRASPAEISVTLGTKGNPSSNAFAIVQWKRKKKGDARLKGDELLAAVKKEIVRRKASVAFLGSGWLAALAKIARAIRKPVGENAQRAERKLNGEKSAIGSAKPATPGVNPTATFFNAAFSEISTTDAGPMAAEGLQRAINQEIGRMAEYISRKEQQRINDAFKR